MLRVLILSFSILFCGSCCNQKTCPGDQLPAIVVKISDMAQNTEVITLYKFDQGKHDSTFIQIDKTNPSFTFFPINDFDDTGFRARQFVVRHNNKSDTIDDINAIISDVQIICDNRWGCGRGFGKEKSSVKKVDNFSFVSRKKNHAINDTLYLN